MKKEINRGANQRAEVFLEVERPWVYWLLILVAGWFGAFTFVLRGGVFCNAQTANVVLLAIALGSGNWIRALHLLIPIGAYFAGAFVSEYMGKTLKRLHLIRWDTLLIGIEVLVVIALGFLPASVPDSVCQVALNFICSMQFNTFRQVKGIPASTTFVTNHIRAVGSSAAKYLRTRNPDEAEQLKVHGILILFFLVGAVISTVFCHLISYYSIWGAAVILLIIFIRLCYADLSLEKNLFARSPRGH